MDLRGLSLRNENYFQVLDETPWSQTALMCIKTEDKGIPRTSNARSEQFFYVEAGSLLMNFGAPARPVHLTAGQSITVPPMVWHDLIKLGAEDLKLWTRFSPPDLNHHLGEFKRRKD